MKKLLQFIFPLPLLTMACSSNPEPATPTGEQAIAVVTTIVQQSPALIDEAKATVEAAKGLGDADFAKVVAAAKQALKTTAVGIDVGVAICVHLPQEEPYTDVCDELPGIKAKAETALATLELLGESRQ